MWSNMYFCLFFFENTIRKDSRLSFYFCVMPFLFKDSTNKIRKFIFDQFECEHEKPSTDEYFVSNLVAFLSRAFSLPLSR